MAFGREGGEKGGMWLLSVALKAGQKKTFLTWSGEQNRDKNDSRRVRGRRRRGAGTVQPLEGSCICSSLALEKGEKFPAYFACG